MRLKIEKFVYGGHGIGYDEGKSFFVPYTLPGEEVEVEILKDKKSYCECELKRIVNTSPLRQEPPCSYYQLCGGCDIQHTPYQNQINLKVEMLKEQLIRVGKLDKEIDEVVVESMEAFRYRNRVQFKFDGKNFGFYRKESNQIVDVSSCLILKEDIDELIRPLKRFLIKYGLCPSSIHIFSNEKNEKVVRFVFKDRSDLLNVVPRIDIIHEEISPLIRGVTFEADGQKLGLGEGFLFYRVNGYLFRVSIDSFFQVNKFLVGRLISKVIGEIGDEGFKRVLDFYCGVGTFSIPTGFYAGEVLGIESNDSAVRDAKANVRHNNLKNVKFLKAKVEKGLKYAFDFKPECIIFDPPRGGVGRDVIGRISNISQVRKIVYVSCNPSTLARDVTYLAKYSFNLRRIKLVDMFPQTHHIESISVFERD